MAQIHNDLNAELNLARSSIANDQLADARDHLVAAILAIDGCVGSTTEIPPAPERDQQDPEAEGLEQLTVDQLGELARTESIDLAGARRKEELIERILSVRRAMAGG